MRGKKSMDHEDAVNELYAAQNGADEGRYLKRAGMYARIFFFNKHYSLLSSRPAPVL